MKDHGDDKYVRLISAGVPLSYRHPSTTSNTSAGATSVTNLTTGFFNTGITTTATDWKYHLCGFKNSSGASITSITALRDLFAANEHTQVVSGVPKVQSMTKKDLDKAWRALSGSTTDTGNTTSVIESSNLLAIPTTDSAYAVYYLAEVAYNYYLWCVYTEGAVVYTYYERGVRPVVSLKALVETTGKNSSGVWQLSPME